MSKFSIDTDKVSSVANDISSLSSTSSSIASSVSGYDTSNEDGFDFSGAKSAIENNVDGMKVKVSNTSVLLDAVVSTHSSLQNSVSGVSDTSSSSNSYGSYSYTGSSYSGGGGGGNNVGGGFGNTNPTASKASSQLVATNETTKNKKETSSASGVIDLAELEVADPLATTEVESALKDNPSAYEKLKEELGKVKSTVSTAESTLNENVEVVLSSSDIKTTSADGIISESFGKALLVVEASTQAPGISKYIKDVSEVAKEHKIEVRFLELDDIIDCSSKSTSYNESMTDDVVTVKQNENVETKENKTTETKEENKTTEVKEEKTEEVKATSQIIINTPTTNVDATEQKTEEQNEVEKVDNVIDEDGAKEINAPEEEQKTNEENQTTEQNDNQQEVIINEDEKELEEQRQKEMEQEQKRQEQLAKIKEEEKASTPVTPVVKTNQVPTKKEEKEEPKKEEAKKEETKPVSSSKIKDKVKYDKLTKIPTKASVKNDILNSPVTMIIKDNLIISAETGILSRDKIEILITTSGISNK